VKVASLDNVLFLLLIGIAALFQLLSTALKKRGKSESNESSTSPAPKILPPIRRAPAESDAERIRKFLEALGQPPSSTPPPPVVPRADIPLRPLAPVRPPAAQIPQPRKLIREEPRKRREILTQTPPVPHVRPEEQTFPQAAPAMAAFEVHKGALPIEIQPTPIITTPVDVYGATKAFGIAKEVDSKADIATLLGSKSGLREAILLREIFGPPRGLQGLDLL
jgi:hypothetical protein